MIRRRADRPVKVFENRYGGAGEVMMTAILNGEEELGAKAGCSATLP